MVLSTVTLNRPSLSPWLIGSLFWYQTFIGKKGTFCNSGNRTAELLSDEKHSALVVAEKYSLAHEKSSATVVAGQRNMAPNWRCSKAESENGRFYALICICRAIVHLHEYSVFATLTPWHICESPLHAQTTLLAFTSLAILSMSHSVLLCIVCIICGDANSLYCTPRGSRILSRSPISPLSLSPGSPSFSAW